VIDVTTDDIETPDTGTTDDLETPAVGTSDVETSEIAPTEVIEVVDLGGDGAEPEAGGLPGDLALRLADPAELASAIEAILFVVEAPVQVAVLAASLQQTTETIDEALERLRTSYDERSAGFELRDIAGGVRLFSRPQHADVVEHFLQDGQRSKLSQAALETLAVIAYRQPVTRTRVSAIRGVSVDGVVRTLLARGLIVEVGTDPETGGGLFRTTDIFLEKMGLRSLDELPSLAPLLPDIDGLDAIDGFDTDA
jgi:segregation and condensation protein B